MPCSRPSSRAIPVMAKIRSIIECHLTDPLAGTNTANAANTCIQLCYQCYTTLPTPAFLSLHSVRELFFLFLFFFRVMNSCLLITRLIFGVSFGLVWFGLAWCPVTLSIHPIPSHRSPDVSTARRHSFFHAWLALLLLLLIGRIMVVMYHTATTTVIQR